ncbi:hypothetical protein D3C81_942590 [compost metagenome]
MLRHAGTREDRNPGEQGEVAGQRQHHPLSQRGNRQVQRVAVQPGQPWKQVQRPTQAVGGDRQHQGVEPEKDPGSQAGEHTATVGLLPVQGAEHSRGQLRYGGKGDLADGCQARRGTEQAVADVGQQQDDNDGHSAYREHPVAEHFERPLGVVAAQQPGQQHVVGDHGRQCHRFNDHHAGGGRSAADERQQCQGRMRFGQR